MGYNLGDLILAALFIIVTLMRKHGMSHIALIAFTAFQFDPPHHIYI